MNNISVKDWVAGQALSALINRAEFRIYNPGELAARAYDIAEAMMDKDLRPPEKFFVESCLRSQFIVQPPLSFPDAL